MNLINLTWILLFVGGGIGVGNRVIPQWYGGIVGGIAGYLVLIAWSNINAHDGKRSPRCICGAKNWQHFRDIESDTWGFVFEAECGSHYILRKGKLWYQVDCEGSPVLRQIKSLYRDWRNPTENEITCNCL